MQFLTRVWNALNPNTGQNIQQLLPLATVSFNFGLIRLYCNAYDILLYSATAESRKQIATGPNISVCVGGGGAKFLDNPFVKEFYKITTPISSVVSRY